ISSSSWWGGTPASSSMLVTSSGKSGSSRLRSEMFTAIERSWPSVSHVLTCCSALQQVSTWLTDGHDLSIAVNISERSLLDPDFPDEVTSMLLDAGVPPHQLELEI